MRSKIYKDSKDHYNVSESKIRLPAEGELLGKVIELVGDDRARVLCQDGKIRIARIPGRFRRKLWLRIGDYVIIAPWDFKPDRADVIHKYEKNEIPELRKYLSDIIDKLEELSI